MTFFKNFHLCNLKTPFRHVIVFVNLYMVLFFKSFTDCFILLMVFVLVVINQEYCEHETFVATCSDGEVVLVTSANYGRQRTGKCIPEKYALYASDLGCSTDVLTFINNKCSGRQSCSFHVSNFVAQLETDCPTSVIRSYFEVSYTCLKGY